jgi:hypothetical protein
MANAIESQSTTLGISTGATSPLGYTDIGEVTSFDGFDGSASEIDVSHLASTAKEFLLGLEDSGSFSFDVNYLTANAGQDLLRTAKANRDLHYFKLTLSDGIYATFTAYVTTFSINGGVDAVVGGSVSLRISGAVTWSA